MRRVFLKYFFLNFVLKDLENSESLKCANQCIDTNQPLKTVLKWWKNNVFDSNTSECLIDLALYT